MNPVPMNPGDRGFGPMMNRQFLVERAHGQSGHPLGSLLLFLVVALVVAFVVWLVLRMMGSQAGTARSALTGPALAGTSLDDALDTARMRYAEGKIDRKEFLRINADLGASAGPGR